MSKNNYNFSSFIKKTLFFFLTLFLVYSLIKNFQDYQKKISFYNNKNQDLQKEQEKNKKLKSDILKSQDYYTTEKKIRQNLNLLKPDEIALIIMGPTISPVPTPTPFYSIHKQWWRLFFSDDM